MNDKAFDIEQAKVVALCISSFFAGWEINVPSFVASVILRQQLKFLNIPSVLTPGYLQITKTDAMRYFWLLVHGKVIECGPSTVLRLSSKEEDQQTVAHFQCISELPSNVKEIISNSVEDVAIESCFKTNELNQEKYAEEYIQQTKCADDFQYLDKFMTSLGSSKSNDELQFILRQWLNCENAIIKQSQALFQMMKSHPPEQRMFYHAHARGALLDKPDYKDRPHHLEQLHRTELRVESMFATKADPESILASFSSSSSSSSSSPLKKTIHQRRRDSQQARRKK
jgi:hypothetical protein